MVTGIADDFNQILLSLSGQAQRSLLDNDADYPDPLLKELETALSSSQQAHELIVRMLAYRKSASRAEMLVDLSETAHGTLTLLRRGGSLPENTELQIAKDLKAGEADVLHIQKMLIQQFRFFVDGLQSATSPPKEGLRGGLGLRSMKNQRCACCYSPIEGEYLELSVEYLATPPDGSELAAHILGEVPAGSELPSQINSLHQAAQTYNGHFMLHSSRASYSWHILVPLSAHTSSEKGLVLDNSVDLASYRERHKAEEPGQRA